MMNTKLKVRFGSIKPSASAALAVLLITSSCSQRIQPAAQASENTQVAVEEKAYPTTGSIETLDPGLGNIIRPDARIEILAEGFDWSEGPLWLPERQAVLLSDIPPNKIFEWSEANGLQPYLTPSGYTGEQARGGEVGSNGLLLDAAGRLVLCQHGDRRMVRMDAPLNNPKPQFTTLADAYEGRKLNSPNDAIYRSDGELYFTDPPYGLEKQMKDPSKEIPFQGVYRLATDGKVHLLTKELSRPNGIAFSPDEKILYVANSDSENAIWMAYDVNENGGVTNGRVFFDATALAKEERGLPDGMKVTREGNLFATGPGGILVFNKDGKHLGTIRTGQATSNCAFNDDESALYITADMYLLRVKLK